MDPGAATDKAAPAMMDTLKRENFMAGEIVEGVDWRRWLGKRMWEIVDDSLDDEKEM